MTILNKQLLHITVEIIVIAGVIFYFSYRHKKLVTRLEEVTKQLEIQAEVIERHEQIINQLIMTIQSSAQHSVSNQVSNQVSNNNQHKKTKKSEKKLKQKPKKEEQYEEEDEDDEEEEEQKIIKNKTPNVSFDKKPQIYEFTENSSSDHDSDLDTEIASELNELNEDGLKKKV
jgi:Tfp pilus assembly protein PilE